jgi:hypothetical protein
MYNGSPPKAMVYLAVFIVRGLPILLVGANCRNSTKAKGVGYGMDMDLYKSRILDSVLVQKRNRMSRCLKLHASVSQLFDTKCTHSRVPGLKGEALFLKLRSFFGVSADPRLVRILIY